MSKANAKRRYDKRTLQLLRNFTGQGKSFSAAAEEVVKCLLSSGTAPTETEIRWLRVVSARLRAEMGDEEIGADSAISDEETRPLLAHIERIDRGAIQDVTEADRMALEKVVDSVASKTKADQRQARRPRTPSFLGGTDS